MKFIVTGDLHLSLYGQDATIPDTGLSERLHYLRIAMDNIAKYAMSNKIQTIVIAGDVLHNKSIIHTLAMHVLLDFLRENSELHFIIIDGNHDLSSRSGQGVSALKSLDTEPNVTMIHKTTQKENILFVPWNINMVSEIKNGNSDYLIAHIGLNEGQLSSGISIISEIGLSNLRQYKECILGHYHKPQQVGNCWYVGSPIQLDWGEKNEEKRFLVVDSNDYSTYSVPTEGYKKHYEFEITSLNKDEIILKTKELQSLGHDVKIIKKTLDVDVSNISGDIRVVDRSEKDITNRGITSTMSEKDKLVKYMQIKDVPEGDFDEYLEVATEIINMDVR